MDYDLNYFRSYHLHQIQELANLMVSGQEDINDVGAMCALLRDRVNEAADYLDQVIEETTDSGRQRENVYFQTGDAGGETPLERLASTDQTAG